MRTFDETTTATTTVDRSESEETIFDVAFVIAGFAEQEKYGSKKDY